MIKKWRERRALLADFEQARGDAQDRFWADRALSRLKYGEVALDVQRELVSQARLVVHDSGEPADELFGPAEWWAASQISDRVAQGLPTFAPAPVATWRDLPSYAFSVMAALYASIAVHASIGRVATGPLSPGWVLFPVVMGLAVGAAGPLFNHVLQRARLAWAVVSAVLAVVAGLLISAGLFAMGDRPSLGVVSVWWGLVPAAIFGVLSWLTYAGARRDTAVVPQAIDDEHWRRRFARALRLRIEVSDRRVRDLLADVSAYNRDMGVNLMDEFGPPEVYADRFEVPPRVAQRRKLVAGLLIGAVFFGGLVFYMQVIARWGHWSWAALGVYLLASMGVGRVMGLMRSAGRRHYPYGGV